ncbi:MAG TPA: hypothetical protein VHY48_08050 [Acidobacteriaceae bacterium]|jgi:hypothetical protein|nr:hypothetical protein [Acidobacteriaceae bacterium]
MDVRKLAVWWGTAICAAALLAASSATAQNSEINQLRHETNASRQARIQRTITDTYTHRWEIYGGGGYLRFRSGEVTQKNNEVSWATSANYYLSQRFAIVADARGSFGNGKPVRGTGSITQAPNPQINEYTFTGGINYRFYTREKLALSLQGTGGVGWGMFSGGSKGLTYIQTGFWQDAMKPAFIGNLNVDYNFYPNLAFRFSPTYVGTTFTSPEGGSIQNNLGFNAGFIFRFGRQ